MTDARLHMTFLTNHKVDGISDAAFRVYVNSIVLGSSQETNGHIPRRSLRLLHPEADLRASAAELEAARLWEPHGDGDGWQVHDFLDYQTPREQLARARANDRERKARERERKSARSKPSRSENLSGPVVTNTDVTRDSVGQDRDRTGQAKKSEPLERPLWIESVKCSRCTSPLSDADLAAGITTHKKCHEKTTEGNAA